MISPSNTLNAPARELAHLFKDILKHNNPVTFTAKGYSMWPFLRSNSTIQLFPTDGKKLSVGNIVAYSTEQRPLVVHRIISIDSDRIICKGDNVSLPDHPITPDDVLGIVRRDRGLEHILDTDTVSYTIAFVSRTTRIIPIGMMLYRNIALMMRRR